MRHNCCLKRKVIRRRGAATVEVAMVAPILFLFFFSSLEFARANMLRNSIHQAAYEGARRGIAPGATAADVKLAASKVLSAAGALRAHVVVDPEVINTGTESINVTISIPMDENGWIVPKFFNGKILSSTIVLTRERDDNFVFQ